jgi:predicted phosphodiesterase
MKVLVFSDTHLSKYLEKKEEFLIDIISQHDKVIINGDFWDNWFINAADFASSRYQKLFKILLDKKAIYIYGNHDTKLFDINNISSLFSSKQCESFNFSLGNTTYHIEHGHRLLKKNNSKMHQLYEKFLSLKIPLVYKTLNLIERIAYKILPDLMKGSKFAQRRNQAVKEEHLTEDFLIIGDTHYPELDLENNFANTGCILHGHASYLSIDEKEIKLIQRRY